MSLIYNGDFHSWPDGFTSPPRNWSLDHPTEGNSVERIADPFIGRHGVRMTRGGTHNRNAHLAQDFHRAYIAINPSLADMVGKTIGFGFWARYTKVGDVLCQGSVTDGLREIHVDSHPGDGKWRWLRGGFTVNDLTNQLTFLLCLDSPTFSNDVAVADYAGVTLLVDEIPRHYVPFHGQGIPAHFPAMQCGPTDAPTGTVFVGPGGMSANEDNVQVRNVGSKITRNWMMRAAAPVGAGESAIATLRADGQDVGEAVRIEGLNQGGENKTKELVLLDGQNTCIKLELSPGAAAVPYRFTCESGALPI